MNKFQLFQEVYDVGVAGVVVAILRTVFWRR